jgi:hypothetical protein
MKRGLIFTSLVCFLFFISSGFVSAWEFNGTIRNVDGIALNNTLVNITIWQMGGPTGMSLIGANSTTSNASGWFNLTVAENSNWMYKPVITQTNSTTGAIDYIGQSLPTFPYREFANTTGINFYLKPAGTINITAINRTGSRINFRYQVKDTKLGYPIQEGFNTAVSEAVIYVPRDRNYSVMIYPNQAMPISFDWNNFSSSSSYNIVAGLSTYNVTTHTVQKTFNATDNLIRLTGYIQNSSGSNFANWNEFKVVPYLLEPGNMIYLGASAGMPYNMSAWNNGQSDIYNLTSGFYNITLPGPAESATYILFATARNGSSYYGGYKNISLSYSDSTTGLNFTMYPLMSTDWGSSNSNITLNDALTWTGVNISSAKQQFNLINSSGSIISNLNAHLEVKVDYTNYGAREFTFMTDLSSGNASFYMPLLNASVKEINIFSQSYSPKSISTRTATQILNNSNITMTTFNPGDIDGSDIRANVRVALYNSNSTCDIPNPDSSCVIADSASMNPNAENSFNPLSSIIGGGKLNFRMGLLASGIIVEYINVDMLASGPPDALFDDSATTSTSGSFDTAMRFGSNGPTIYDYVLISMPYTQGSTSQTGLNENADVNMSIPILYDENWNVMWNSTVNGTNGSALAGNYSHYSTHPSEWQTLMGENNCTRNQSELNSTNPCYIDTTNNRIWIRLPHFSGTQPSVKGSVITATSSQSSSSSGGGGGLSDYTISAAQLSQGYSKVLVKGEKIKFSVNNQNHTLTLSNLTSTNVVIIINSTPQIATLLIGETKKFEINNDLYYDLLVKLNSINNTKANITLSSIYEKISPQQDQIVQEDSDDKSEESGKDTKENISSFKNKLYIFIIGGFLILLIIALVIYFKNKK